MNRALALFGATLLLAGAAALVRPGAAVGPGPLRPSHAALEDSCLSCHAPFRGPENARCSACHAPGTVGLAAAGGGAIAVSRASVARLHERIGAAACASCHAEHALPPGGDGSRPFDHARLDGALRGACAGCHAQDRPADLLHESGGDDCARCHAPSAWKPSTFDHDARFRFDRDHPPRCTDCHGPAVDVRSYTCTGCHAHAPARMEKEHAEEGITDLSACARCHRTGDADDTPDGGHRARDGDRDGDDRGRNRRRGGR